MNVRRPQRPRANFDSESIEVDLLEIETEHARERCLDLDTKDHPLGILNNDVIPAPVVKAIDSSRNFKPQDLESLRTKQLSLVPNAFLMSVIWISAVGSVAGRVLKRIKEVLNPPRHNFVVPAAVLPGASTACAHHTGHRTP